MGGFFGVSIRRDQSSLSDAAKIGTEIRPWHRQCSIPDSATGFHGIGRHFGTKICFAPNCHLAQT